MGERKWEDLDLDCLVNVIGRVGVESLLFHVPYVCKSWHKASLDASCWKRLVFRVNFDSDEYCPTTDLLDVFVGKYKIENIWVDAFTKFVVGRSHGRCTCLILPNCCTAEILNYVAYECPALVLLGLPSLALSISSIVPTLIGKLEHLENLWLVSCRNLINIIIQIRLVCSKFHGLRISFADIREREASAIVTNLPNIKYLILKGGQISKSCLEILLKGCKSLVHLDVSDCYGFDPHENILELASNIKTFKYEGSSPEDPNDYVIDYDVDYDVDYDDYSSR